MKKLTFKVSSPKEGSIIALIKKVNNIECRIKLDIENGIVIVENINDSMIDTVIELIDNYYTLLGVDIDNSVENDVVVSSVEEITEKSEHTESVSKVDTIAKTLEPQTEDDLIIKKVEFENEYVEQLVNKLLRTIYWAMFKMNIPEKEIGEFIWTSINEISMSYNKKDNIAFSIGDVVDCNYGKHLVGEIQGAHVSAIVCNISDTGMVYLVPITKTQKNLTSHSYLKFTVPNDINYYTLNYTDGTALLDKGKYVRPSRFHEVIGKTSPEFFAEVLRQLSTTFDFTTKNAETEIGANNCGAVTDENTTSENSETVAIQDFDRKEQNATEAVFPESATINDVTKKVSKKDSDVEKALLETLGSAFDKLDSSKKVEEQIDSFMADIGMPISERLIRQSFVIACDIKKITYGNVILELHNMYPKIKENIIQASLKENFKKWLEQYPELAKKCHRISLMSLLKLFAKRFR